jgi:hypothetical protein
MRAHLLATGVVVEGQLTTADWEDALAGKCRVIAFNGVRGVWEAQPRVLG